LKKLEQEKKQLEDDFSKREKTLEAELQALKMKHSSVQQEKDKLARDIDA